MKLTLMVGFSGILDTGRRSEDDERQINIWKRIVSRFRGKLVKMIVNLMIIQSRALGL